MMVASGLSSKCNPTGLRRAADIRYALDLEVTVFVPRLVASLFFLLFLGCSGVCGHWKRHLPQNHELVVATFSRVLWVVDVE